MSTVASLMVKIDGDVSGLQRGLQDAQSKLNNFGDNAMRIGGGMTKYVTAPIVAAFAGVGKAAMDLEATEAKYNAVFDGMTATSDQFIKDFQKLTPATTSEARSMASGIQDLLVPMGFVREEATGMTEEFMHVTGALANFNSGTHSAADVANAMQSALAGQYMPLRSLGIQLDKTTIYEKALEQGLVSTKDEMTKQIEAQVMLSEVYAQSGDALGAYTEENLDAKTKMGLMKAEIVDVAAEFGQSLLPIIEKVVEGIRGLVDWFAGLTEGQQQTIMIIAAVVAAIGPLLMFVGMVAKGLAVLAGVFGAISLPVLAVIGVIVALIAIFKHLWETNEEFRAAVIGIWESIKESAAEIWGALQELFSAIADRIREIWDNHGEAIMKILTTVWDQIKLTIETVMNIIKGIIQFITAIIRGDWSAAWEAMKSIGQTIWNFIKNTALNIFKILQTGLSLIWEAIKTAAIRIWENIKQSVIRKANDLRQGVIDTVDRAVQWIRDLPGKAIQWGKDIIQGLIDGVKRMASNLAGAIKGVVDGAVNKVKDFLGISSPSRLFEGIGVNIGAGMERGILAMQSAVNNAMVGMATPNLSPATAGASGGGSGNSEGSRTVTIDMNGLFAGANITIGSERDAKALAKEIYGLASGRARSEGVLI